MLIMSIAIIATLASLFTIAWPDRSNKETGASHPSTAAAGDFAPVPDVTLHMPTGTLQLHSTLPAVVLLVDGCACGDLISQTAQAVGPGVTVLAVAHSLPTLPSPLPAGRKVIAASDEDSRLRDAKTLCDVVPRKELARERVLVAGDLNALTHRDPYPGLAEKVKAAHVDKYGHPPRFDTMEKLDRHGFIDLLHHHQQP